MKNTTPGIGLEAEVNVAKICKLMSKDEYYGDFLLRDIRRIVIPPVSLGQCIYFKRTDNLVGFMTYATVSQSVEREVILADRRIQPEHWSSGDRLWIIDAILDVPNIQSLRQPIFDFFKTFDEVKYLRRDAQQKIKTVLRYRRKGERFVTAKPANVLKES